MVTEIDIEVDTGVKFGVVIVLSDGSTYQVTKNNGLVPLDEDYSKSDVS